MTLKKLQVKGSTTECITAFIISEVLFFQNYIQIAEEGINKCGVYTHTHNGILLSHKKEWNGAICKGMDGPRDCHIEISQKEKNKYHIILLLCGI